MILLLKLHTETAFPSNENIFFSFDVLINGLYLRTYKLTKV